MADFEEFIRNERKKLGKRRDDLLRQKADLDRQIAEIDQELAAIDAYERTKKGAPSAAPGRKRRSGVRQVVLDVVARHRNGIKRADILEEMHAKGDKRAEQSISNALSNLKKQGQIRLEQGAYMPEE